MRWGYFYIAVSVLLVLATLRNDTKHLHAATALVFWQVMGMVWYQFNVIESEGRIMAAGVYVFLCGMLYFVHKSKLFGFLGCLGVSAIAWTLMAPIDPYYYKAGLNVLWLTGVAAVWIHTFYSRSLLA